jgi:hypothetical protein
VPFQSVSGYVCDMVSEWGSLPVAFHAVKSYQTAAPAAVSAVRTVAMDDMIVSFVM